MPNLTEIPVSSVEDGAKVSKWDDDCPICGKKRGPNCQNKISFMECPNKGVACKNKEGNQRIGCTGYQSGHSGVSSRLEANILSATYNLPKTTKIKPTRDSLIERINEVDGLDHSNDKGSHPIYIGTESIEAHHLICTKEMKDRDERWEGICKMTGYNINCKLNGVFLPSDMELACYLYIQRHEGSHGKGRGEVITQQEDELEQKAIMDYVSAVNKRLNIILGNYSFPEDVNKKCKPSDAESIVSDLNVLSNEICEGIADFTWLVAWDSKNYDPDISPRIGCANANNLVGKKKILFQSLGQELRNKKLIPKTLKNVSDVEKKWISKKYDDMETIQRLTEDKQNSTGDKQDNICCTDENREQHFLKFGTILESKTMRDLYEVKVGH